MKDIKNSSDFIKQFLKKYNIPEIVITEVIATCGLFIIGLIGKKILSLFKVQHNLYYIIYERSDRSEIEELLKKVSDLFRTGSIDLQLLIWVLFSVLILVAIPIWILFAKYRKYTKLNPQIEQILQNEDFANAMNVLRDYTNANDSVLSIQLYSVTPLPESVNSEDIVSVDLLYKGGTIKDATISEESVANVNAMLSMHYQLQGGIYNDLKKLLNDREAYFRNVKKKVDTKHALDIYKSACTLFDQILKKLNSIQDISAICDEHYAEYRVLRLLVDIILSPPKNNQDTEEEKPIIIKDGSLLHKEKQAIEAQLISGQRTGVLGAILRGSLYHFGNDNSLVKKNRCYFATPFVLRDDAKMVMLVVLRKDLMRLEPEQHCKLVHDEINKALNE